MTSFPPPPQRALPAPPSLVSSESRSEQVNKQSVTSAAHYIDMALDVVDSQFKATRQTNSAQWYDTPRAQANNNCHCDITCVDGRQLRRHLRNKHPEHCEELFHCAKCKLTFHRRDSALNHFRRFHDGKSGDLTRPVRQ